MSKPLKVLLISYSFPPLLTAEAIQSGRVVKFLKREGVDISVLTVKETSSLAETDKTLITMLPDDLIIERTRSFESKSLRFLLRRSFPMLVTLPDEKVLWRFSSTNKALSMTKNFNYDLIYTRSSPLTSHLVGLRIKNETRLPWVAHFSDPWVDNPYITFYSNWHKKFNERLESLVIIAADAVIFVSDETKELVAKKYGYGIKKKLFVIPHCFDTEAYPSSLVGDKKQKITFTYTGNFYGERSPLPLFKALQIMVKTMPLASDNFRVIFVGLIQKEYLHIISQCNLRDIVKCVGQVSYLQSLEYMVNSDILLLIDAPAKKSVFFPSKLADYIGTRKPILGISPLEGSSAKILKELGYSVVSPDDPRAIAAEIMKFLQEEERLQVPRENRNNIEKYKGGNIAESLKNIFRKVA